MTLKNFMSQAGGDLPAGRPACRAGGQAFFTTIGCMDGRVQEPIAKFGREKFGVLYGDTITEAGLVGVLSQNVDDRLLKSLKGKIDISVKKHHSRGIIVHGHQDCAASDAVDDEKHKDDIRRSVEIIKSLISSSIPVIGVFVRRSSEDSSKWVVEEIPQTQTVLV